MGDPVGVGPEIVLRALASTRVRRIAETIVVGDRRILDHVAERLKLRRLSAGRVISISSLDPKRLKPGRPLKKTSLAMTGYVEEAVRMCMDGRAHAMVTAPINKEAAQKAGFKFPGHTEFIAGLTGCKDYRMMLGGPGPSDLKVVLSTIHEPIRKVPGLITTPRVLKTIEITHNAFYGSFKTKKPRIAVAGLNPHAGEAGRFGDEEERTIAPAVKMARRRGIDATGPLPPDTVFYRTAVKKEFDCVVCMYHDQGLGPLKLLHFEDGVNATLGLPIIRTSVDHGTAYEIAWRGTASPRSLISAIETASRFLFKKRSHGKENRRFA